MSLEEDTERLREENKQLLEAREDLTNNCCRLKASLDHLQTHEAAREEAALAQAEGQHCEIVALEAQLAVSQKEATKLHYQLLKLRQELGIVRAARDFYKNRATGPVQTGGISSNINNKIKSKTSRIRRPLRQLNHRIFRHNQAINWHGCSLSPTKDEWEDISVDR